MTIQTRIEVVARTILEKWRGENRGLGVRRSQLESFGAPERLYIIRRALAKLRKEKRLWLDKRYYCIDSRCLDSLKSSMPVQEIAA